MSRIMAYFRSRTDKSRLIIALLVGPAQLVYGPVWFAIGSRNECMTQWLVRLCIYMSMAVFEPG